MKKLITIALALGIMATVSAQHGRVIAGSRVVIVSPSVGFGFGYSPFYYSPFGYPYGYPYGYYNSPYRSSSKLQRETDELRTDYADKIRSAKKDKSLSKEERSAIVRQLKDERDKAIKDLKANYYKPKKTATDTDNKG